MIIPSIRRALAQECEQRLRRELSFLCALFADPLASTPTIPTVDPLAKALGRQLEVRVTVIKPDGVVLGDSEVDPALMGNHADRPEVREALQGGLGRSSRKSGTLGTDYLYLAQAVQRGSEALGVVRVSVTSASVGSAVGGVVWWAVGGMLAAAGAALLVALWTASSLSGVVRRMTSAVLRMAEGDLSQRVRPVPPGELGELANGVNAVAERLGGMLEELAASEGTLRTAVSSMTDGVVLTDTEGKVALINSVAQQMLGIRDQQAVGKTVLDATLSAQLSATLARAVESGEVCTAEVTLLYPHRRVLSAAASPVKTERGPAGCVLVLHDVTEARRLDEVRREFIANASHELKTPLSSIRIMVESLQAGGKDDPEVEDEFLEVIKSEVDRLAAIVEDMLELSAVEAGTLAVRSEPTPVFGPVALAVDRVRPRLEAKGQHLAVDVPQDILIRGDSDAVERVVTNLLDNAVKYTPEGGRITVAAERRGERVLIRVSDTGIGIPPEHLDRIFERFYRVDKGRSRELGGTGLGLSIVKHLVEAHGGTVSVESVVGEGSVFTVDLPAAG